MTVFMLHSDVGEWDAVEGAVEILLSEIGDALSGIKNLNAYSASFGSAFTIFIVSTLRVTTRLSRSMM